MSKQFSVQFGVAGLGCVEEEDDQIDSSKQPQVDVSNVFGGEAKAPVQRTPSNTYDQVKVGGLNATKMQRKPKMVTGSTSTEGEDPVGLIPSAAANPSKYKEVEIKAGQFTEPSEQFPDIQTGESSTGMKTHEMSCGTEDLPIVQPKKEPKLKNVLQIAKEREEAKNAEIEKKKADEEKYALNRNETAANDSTNSMLRILEEEMTRGRKGGAESGTLDQLMFEISQTSEKIVKGRKDIIKKADEENKGQAPKNDQSQVKKETKSVNEEQKEESNRQKKKRQNQDNKAHLIEKKKQFAENWAKGNNVRKTQEQVNEQKNNRIFVDYYQGLKMFPMEEWEAFYGMLKQPLDVCFRINSIDKHWQRTLLNLQNRIDQIISDPETKGRAPKKVKWYPNQMVYCFDDVGRTEMRKSPAFKDFHRFMVTETENGRLFRQEKVSMIPVTLLKIEPDHKVLDMCAAPGSKTIQILEYLHQSGKKMNKGFVVANDTDMKRASMLTHQARRLNSPSLFVVNNDARFLPNLRIDNNQNNLKFDRILCDVPCSGDGTFRKNSGLWNTFHAHMGHVNHELQLEILERGFKMLKKGGRLVYSTCSFNPIENEAVVAAALARHIKQIQIVDVSKEVSPHLKYRQGLSSWQVYHRGKGKRHPPEWYKSFIEVPDWKRKVIKQSMFTSTYTDFNNDEDRQGKPELHADPLNLKKCMRFYPQDDNQGGFFVCVMEKILDEEEGLIFDDDYSMDAWNNPKVRQKDIIEDLHEFVADFEKSMKEQEELTGEKLNELELKMMKDLIDDEYKKRKQDKEESKGTLSEQILDKKDGEESQQFPYAKLIDHKLELWQWLSEFFGIDESKFPFEYLAFQQDTNRNIVLLNEGLNEFMGYRRKNKLKVVIIGLKMFCRNRIASINDGMSEYRIVQEGLDILLPYMSDKRKIVVPREMYVKMTEIHDHMLTLEALKTDWGFDQFSTMEAGSAVMIFEDFAVAIWIGKNNVSLMISKEEINSIRALMEYQKTV